MKRNLAQINGFGAQSGKQKYACASATLIYLKVAEVAKGIIKLKTNLISVFCVLLTKIFRPVSKCLATRI